MIGTRISTKNIIVSKNHIPGKNKREELFHYTSNDQPRNKLPNYRNCCLNR
ncbi:protein of unknown function [Candidatus Nitrosocosmicus franklandus]|uniref:Uncharacterized protein n=1 Tax=Candidatus Nitrosocosmicus franklandianus TaxID=1798806 RepID=A0A484IJ68_9ARCH|nr:protein of unknown function [Candidatus Nitrosocosmicus franklandus]